MTGEEERQLDLARYARESISVGSKSFAGASRLFDTEMRASVQMLYSWCRHCDDVIDGQVSGHASGSALSGETVQQRLAGLRASTERALAGDPDSPAFAALAYVAARHRLPARYPFELLTGFEMDATERRYDSLEDTIEYSYHVAGVVGIMMAIIMGVADESTLDRACDLGIGFQLTNISRDVMDDASVGRVYLPRDWLAAEGVTPEHIADGAQREGVSRVVSRLLDTAEAYYDSAFFGLRALPWRAACAIGTARRVYREIGRQVRRRRASAWDRRVVVTRPRKIVGAVLAVGDVIHAHGVAGPVPPRAGLWTRP